MRGYSEALVSTTPCFSCAKSQRIGAEVNSCFLLVDPVEFPRVALDEFGYRGSDRGETFDETSVKIGETNKDLNVVTDLWTFPTENRLRLGQGH